MAGLLPSLFLPAVLLLSLLLSGCGGGEAAVPAGIAPGPGFAPTRGFLERKAAYLAHCNAGNGPGDGGIYGQVCRAYAGETRYNEEAIYDALEIVTTRSGSADFRLNGLLRLLYLDRECVCLPENVRADLEAAVLGFKYWLDEPGPDDLQWWSENHQILYHAAEIMAGQLFPEAVFTNSGMTGAEHVAHAEPMAERWMDRVGTFGFGEWHSNVYFNEDMPALLNLAEFAQNEAISTKAAMLLDLMTFDMVMNFYRGRFATTHGRTYPERLLNGLRDSVREAVWILTGLGDVVSVEELSGDHFTASLMATNDRYFPPPILEGIARDAEPAAEHRQRDGIDLEEGPVYGIGYESYDDVMFWWGRTGYVAPETIDGSLRLIDDFNLWEGVIWRDVAFLKPLVGTPVPRAVAEVFEPMTRGIVLEAVSTYTYRTPHYQLSGAQDYKPAHWTGQVHVWKATLDPDAYVFTSYPGGLEDDYAGGSWTGGWTPRATFHRNVGVIQYRRPRVPLLDAVLFTDYSHAYVPRSAFDEFVETGRWVMGRKGGGYVALWSRSPTAWSEENDYELIADARENVWIVELGRAEENGSFAAFVAAVEGAEVRAGETVAYDSPSVGRVEVGWEGPMTVDGHPVDLGPYARWDNDYCFQPFGTRQTRIDFQGRRLELDFETPARRYGAAP